MAIDKDLAAYVKHLHDNGYLLQQEVIAAQCIHYGWITVTVNDAWDKSYDITALGEIALGIGATEDTGAGDALADAILSVLKDSEPMTDFEIRELLLAYEGHAVRDAIVQLNKAGKIVFRNDQYHNKLYFIDTPQTSTPEPAAPATGYTVEHGDQLMRGNQRVHFQNDHNLILHPTDVAKLANILNTETAHLRDENARLQAELADAIKTADFNQDRIDDLDHMVNEAREERDRAWAREAKLQARVQELINEIQANNLRTEPLEAHLTSLSKLYDGKHERLEELKRELEVSREARRALEKVIQTAATYLAETNSSDANVGRAYNVLQGFASADDTD